MAPVERDPAVLRLPLLDRLVADRMALEDDRTPPVEAPPPAEPEDIAGLVDPPDDPLIAEDVLATVPLAAELEDDAPEEADDDPPLLPDPLLDPPPLDPLLDPLPPPPPRLRPIAAPLPPEKLRLPRNCGPKMVTNFSGPVVPLMRMESTTLPPPTDATRVAAAARFCATASAPRLRWNSHQAEPPTIPKINIHSHNREGGLAGGSAITGFSCRSGGCGAVSGAGAVGLCMVSKPFGLLRIDTTRAFAIDYPKQKRRWGGQKGYSMESLYVT